MSNNLTEADIKRMEMENGIGQPSTSYEGFGVDKNGQELDRDDMASDYYERKMYETPNEPWVKAFQNENENMEEGGKNEKVDGEANKAAEQSNESADGNGFGRLAELTSEEKERIANLGRQAAGLNEYKKTEMPVGHSADEGFGIDTVTGQALNEDDTDGREIRNEETTRFDFEGLYRAIDQAGEVFAQVSKSFDELAETFGDLGKSERGAERVRGPKSSLSPNDAASTGNTGEDNPETHAL